jgi:hypothetical protein
VTVVSEDTPWELLKALQQIESKKEVVDMPRLILFIVLSMLTVISCNLFETVIPQNGNMLTLEVSTPTITDNQTPEIDIPPTTDETTQVPVPTDTISITATSVTEVPPIGSVTREQDVVEKGALEAMLEVLIGTHPLFNGESLKVSNGGEGLLDFGNNVELRLFNDSVLGQIRLESAPGTPLDIRMFLESGGFTGVVTETGGKVVVETPNGAEIVVSGTEFFVIHDHERSLTVAGNFSGEIEMVAAGALREIPESSFRWVGADLRISPALPFPLSKESYEIISREARSPLTAFAIGIQDLGLGPPEILSVETDPEIIFIGNFCPDNPGTTQVEVDTLSRGGLIQVVVDWVQGESSGQVVLESEDGEFYTGEVGPFEEFLTVELRVTATDFTGAIGQSEPIFVEVVACIG